MPDRPGRIGQHGVRWAAAGALLLGGCCAASPPASTPIPASFGFGSSICAIDDCNGDGIADFVVGAPGSEGAAFEYPGLVFLISGRDGAALSWCAGSTGVLSFGSSVAAVRDMDGDGLKDLLVGAPMTGVNGPDVAGSAAVVSSGTMATLARWDGQRNGEFLGSAVAGYDRGTERVLAIGGPYWFVDLFNRTGRVLIVSPGEGGGSRQLEGQKNMEGLGLALCFLDPGRASPSPRLAAGSCFWKGDRGGRQGRVVIVDCSSLEVVGTLVGPAGNGMFGVSLAEIRGSAPGDCRLVVGAPGAQGGEGEVSVYSGESFSFVYGVRGDRPGVGFGAMVAELGDLDGDGWEDFIIGCPEYGTPGLEKCGRAVVHSGRTGARLLDVRGSERGGLLGTSACGLPDWDGDGIPEILLGAPGMASGRGSVLVLSGKTGDVLLEIRIPCGAAQQCP